MLLAIPAWATHVRIINNSFQIYFYGSNPNAVTAKFQENSRNNFNNKQYVGIYTGNTSELPAPVFFGMKLPKVTNKYSMWYLNGKFHVVTEDNVPYKEALLTDLIVDE